MGSVDGAMQGAIEIPHEARSVYLKPAGIGRCHRVLLGGGKLRFAGAYRRTLLRSRVPVDLLPRRKLRSLMKLSSSSASESASSRLPPGITVGTDSRKTSCIRLILIRFHRCMCGASTGSGAEPTDGQTETLGTRGTRRNAANNSARVAIS